MVGAEGIEPSTSSASGKHSATELRAFTLKPIYPNSLPLQSQYNVRILVGEEGGITPWGSGGPIGSG